jgi:hypothetical protein
MMPVSIERLRQSAGAPFRQDALALALFVILAGGFFLSAYLSHPNHYPVGHKLTWWNWWDQGRYIASARAIRAGDLNPAEHHYPVGYPAIGAIFYDVMPNNPFLIPNFLCFGIICVTFILICQRVVGFTEALLVCFFGVVWQATVRDNLVIPWSTVPRHAAMYILAWLAIFRNADPMYPRFSGFCLAVIYAVRPGDVLFALPLLAVPLMVAVRERRVTLFVKRFALAAGPIVVAVHLFNYLVYAAAFPRAYAAAVASVGFNLRFIPAKAFSMFVNPQVLYGEPYSLVAAFPYLLLVLPGAAVFIKRFRAAGVTIVASQALTLLYYLAYNDFGPGNVFRFLAVHYIVWLLPFCLFYAYLTLRLAWKELGILPTAALLLLSAMLFLLPNIVVNPAGGRVPAVLSTGPNEVTFAGPGKEFDILLLAGVQTWDIDVWFDQRQLQMRRDFQMTLPEKGPGAALLFYSPQRAGTVRVRMNHPGAESSLASANALYGNRQWSITLRDPRTFLLRLPDILRFTNTLAGLSDD